MRKPMNRKHLDDIRGRTEHVKDRVWMDLGAAAAASDRAALLAYVDLLHEEIRLGRAELVAEKHKCLELRRGQGGKPEGVAWRLTADDLGYHEEMSNE